MEGVSRTMDKRARLEARAPRRHPEGGGAAVEFALVLPLFMALVMGALDYGYFFFSQQVVTNAAREGAGGGDTCISVGFPLTVVPAIVCPNTCVHVRIEYNTVSLTGFTSVVLPSKVQASSVMSW
jgi:hypothetical protein